MYTKWIFDPGLGARSHWHALYGFCLVAGEGSFARAARTAPRGSTQRSISGFAKLEQPNGLESLHLLAAELAGRRHRPHGRGDVTVRHRQLRQQILEASIARGGHSAGGRGKMDVIISSPWTGSRRLSTKAAAPIRFELIAVPRYPVWPGYPVRAPE